MKYRSSGRALASVFALLGLTGCVTDSLEQFGPRPVMSAAAIEQASQSQVAVVDAMIYASVGRRADVFVPVGRAEWHRVVLAGFNIIDDACESYIHDLWVTDRRKSRALGIITSTGAATSAIIAANANPSAITLAILTQAFGLAHNLVNDVSESYLFTKNPATIQTIVRKLRFGYRQDLADNLGNESYPLASYPAAYHHMREYLSLCLPPTIEAEIEGILNVSKAVPAGSAEEQRLTAERQRAGAAFVAPSAALSTSGGGARRRSGTMIKLQ
jgi:hypothetical protein